MYHSKKIGVFISHIFGEYQHQVCQGIFDTATEYGYLVEIFHSTDGENPGTLQGESGILDVPSYHEYDGIILALGTYLEPALATKIQEHLQNNVNCPILTIQQNNSHNNNIILDNDSPFADLISHFIDIHQYKRICFLGCSAEDATTQARLDIYQNTLSQYNITPNEHDVFICNYGISYAKQALTYFTQNGYPDAIVCYNDRMALDIIYAANEMGYSIPKDFAISGCDNLELSQNITPTLTTITFPTYEIGQAAVARLLSMINKESFSAPHIVKASTHIGCSCGCHYRTSTSPYYAVQQMHEIADKERRIYRDMQMAAALHEVNCLEDGMELVKKYYPDITHCHELYICLYNNWDNAPKHIHMLTAPYEIDDDNTYILNDSSNRSIQLALGICNNKTIQSCSFTKNCLLPTSLIKNNNSHYICSPLYFQDQNYGYIVLAFEHNHIHYDFHVTSWINNISRMLKRIADTKHMSMLVNRLEDIYLRDELTALYNQRGFESMSAVFVDDVISSGAKLLAVSVDIDHLKDVNQNFGHAEGNFVIQVVTGALHASFDDTAIIARIADDEFYILAAGLESTDADSCIAHIHKYIENYNKLGRKPYNISVSCGYSLSTISQADQLNVILRNADLVMYQKKSSL